MNILVLNYEFPPLGGGAAPVSRDLSIALSKAGNEVDVVTMGYKDLPDKEEMEGITIYRLKCIRSSKSSCKPWEQFSYLMAVKKFMKQHMKNHSYDICHCHFVIPTGEAARVVKKKYNIPYVITAHGSDVEGHNKKKSMIIMHRFLRPFWRKIVRESEGVISPSAYLKDRMQHNYPKGRYALIPNGINYDLFKSLDNREAKENVILIMGRLQSFKNVQYVLRELDSVDNNLIKHWKVVILGDGPYRPELEKLTDTLSIKDRITFMGWIDNGTKEQLDIIASAKIYISASRFENCPMSVIETAVSGCHVLVSDIPAHRQLIDKEECFFKTDEEGCLKDRITKILLEKTDCHVEDMDRYKWDKITERYLEYMKEVVNE